MYKTNTGEWDGGEEGRVVRMIYVQNKYEWGAVGGGWGGGGDQSINNIMKPRFSPSCRSEKNKTTKSQRKMRLIGHDTRSVILAAHVALCLQRVLKAERQRKLYETKREK